MEADVTFNVMQLSPKGSTWNTVAHSLTEAEADAKVAALIADGYPARKVSQEARPTRRPEMPRHAPRDRKEDAFRRAVADVMRRDGRHW